MDIRRFDDNDATPRNWTPFDAMRRSMENMMGGFGSSDLRNGGWSWAGADRMGDFRTERTESGYLLLADVPGFEKSEIDVVVDGDELIVAAERETDEQSEGRSFRGRRSVRRSMTLPDGVRVDDITATYRNGVLEIELPADLADDDATHVRIE